MIMKTLKEKIRTVTEWIKNRLHRGDHKEHPRRLTRMFEA